MDCREVRRVVFLFTDREMGQDLMISFQEHMEVCPECARHIEYTRRVLTVIRDRCCRQGAPARLRLRILSRMAEGQGSGEGWE